MKSLTVSVSDEVIARTRVAAAQDGKSLPRFASELIERRMGRPLSQKDAMARFLAGPLMDLTDETGRAPSRDKIYDR